MSPATHLIVVIGHGAELVVKELGSEADFVTQEQQLGTGHAVFKLKDVIKDYNGQILVISADMPLLRKGRHDRRIDPKHKPGITVRSVIDRHRPGFPRVWQDHSRFSRECYWQSSKKPRQPLNSLQSTNTMSGLIAWTLNGCGALYKNQKIPER